MEYIKNKYNKFNKNLMTKNNILIVFLIIYILIFKKLQKINYLLNNFFIKLILILLIFYYTQINLFISILLAIILTSINYKLPENFRNKLIKLNKKHKKSTNDDSEDSNSENTNSINSESETESDSDSESESDTDSESSNSKSKKFYNDNEGFNINNLKPSKNLDDGFKKLHKAIHELEGFIKK